MPVSMSVQCHCGGAIVDLHNQPAARANCHCDGCRDFYGTSMLSATAWSADAVQLTRGQVASYAHPIKQLSRTFCVNCGETLFGTNRLGMRVVPNAIVARAAGGTMPDDWRPTMHLFYRHRVIDVTDELIKYLDGWDGTEYESSKE